MDIIRMRHNMLMNACQFSYAEATGNPIAFNTRGKKPISRARISFAPWQSGSGDASPTNPRPINGWNDVAVYHTGKNLFNAAAVEQHNGHYILDDGTEDVSSVSGYTFNYTPVLPNTTYTISGTVCNPNNSNFRLYYYTSDKTWISRTGQIRPTSGFTTFTTPDNCYFIRIQYIYSYVQFNTIQIELGSAATEYEAYCSTDAIFPGKNLLNESTIINGYYDASGNPDTIVLNDNYRTIKINLEPGIYTWSTDLSPAYFLRVWYNNTNHEILKSQSSYSIAIAESQLVAISFRKGTASEIQSITEQFHTMIEKGAVATKYEPYLLASARASWRYSDIVKPNGKNLFDDTMLIVGYFPTTHINYITEDNRYRTILLPLPAGTYTISTDLPTARFLRAWYDNTMHTGLATGNAITFTSTTDGIVGCVFRKTDTSEITETIHTMIEESMNASTYEPYNNSIYGGYIDITTGEIWKTWNSTVFDGSESWLLYSNVSEGTSFYLKDFNEKPLGYQTSMCETYKNVDKAWSSQYPNSLGIYSDHATAKNIYFRPPVNEITTVNQFKLWLAANPLKYVYMLETPVLVGTIPKQRLLTFNGNNCLWSNTNGNMEITY